MNFISEDIDYTEYVKLEDLDREFDEDSHPKIKQVQKYLRIANSMLTGYLGTGILDLTGGIKNVGIALVKIQIHNRKFEDGMVNYEKRLWINPQMESQLLSEHFEGTDFSFQPSGGFT